MVLYTQTLGAVVKRATMTIKLLRIMILLIGLSITLSWSRYIIPGKYQTNFATYGMFGKTLTINCDSTVIMNFAGNLMNDKSYGKWTIDNDTLLIAFDTINYSTSRYKNDLNFRVKGKRLYNIPYTRAGYIELFEKIRQSGNDTIDLQNYRKFNRNLDKNISNYKGTMKRHYFKRVEKFDCEI